MLHTCIIWLIFVELKGIILITKWLFVIVDVYLEIVFQMMWSNDEEVAYGCPNNVSLKQKQGSQSGPLSYCL